MARSTFSVNMNDFDNFVKIVQDVGESAEGIINDYLHNKAGDKIKKEIQPLIPVSGRSWKGKKAPASAVDPFTQLNENLAVTVHTKYNYHYLYFPDDGSNTIKHFGDKQFMLRGAEAATDEITKDIINKLLEKI